jgi:hypothetical protein
MYRFVPNLERLKGKEVERRVSSVEEMYYRDLVWSVDIEPLLGLISVESMRKIVEM